MQTQVNRRGLAYIVAGALYSNHKRTLKSEVVLNLQNDDLRKSTGPATLMPVDRCGFNTASVVQ